MATTEDLLAQFMAAHPKCRVCGGDSETVREASNPPWGLDESRNYSPRKTIDGWLTEVDPENVVGVCFQHLQTARSGNGGWIDTQSRDKPRSGNWMVRKGTERREARDRLVEALGGGCQKCSKEVSNEELRLVVPERSRRQFGFTSIAAWWDFVRETPELRAEARLLCISCNPSYAGHTGQRRDAKAEVVEAYGGRCCFPGCTTTEGLMVTALPGTPTLRWPNGDKYTSVAKIAYLARHDYPDGWGVVCGLHLHKLGKK